MLFRSQFDAIFRNYQANQLKNQHLLAERKNEIFLNIPEYQEIENTISSLCVEQAKKMLDGDENAIQELKVELNNLRQKKKKLLKEHHIPEDYLSPIYTCDKCKDSGYINGEKCSCLKQAMIRLLYQQSNLEIQLESDNFHNLSYEYYTGDDLNRFSHAVELSKKYAKNYDRDYHNLLFYGTVGTGKSFLSGCIAKEVMDHGGSVLYFSAAQLFEELSKNTFSKQKNESSQIFEDIYQCDLFIIDDLGTELGSTFVTSNLFSILNGRNLRKKPTIISTNLSLEEVNLRYSERIFSRITSSFDILKLSGPDIRMCKKRQGKRK